MASTCQPVTLVRPSADSLGLMVVSQDRLLEADGDFADYIQGRSYLMSAFGQKQTCRATIAGTCRESLIELTDKPENNEIFGVGQFNFKWCGRRVDRLPLRKYIHPTLCNLRGRNVISQRLMTKNYLRNPLRSKVNDSTNFRPLVPTTAIDFWRTRNACSVSPSTFCVTDGNLLLHSGRSCSDALNCASQPAFGSEWASFPYVF